MIDNNAKYLGNVKGRAKSSRQVGALKFFLYSFIGLFLYFIPVEINGESAILLKHAIDWIGETFKLFIPYYALIMVLIGGIVPVISGKWKESKFDFTFTVAKLLGCIIAVMAVFNIGPEFLMAPDMIPFLWDLIVVPILLMIPVTIISLVLLLNYGILEFLSIFFQPIMKLIWKTPGASALDAMVSFTGGYAAAVIVTNDLYKRGIYSLKEAIIIATGFSTVSITFLVVIADTLDLMKYWNIYFFSCFIITFLVSAITARIYPISKKPNTYYDKPAEEKTDMSGNIFVRATNAGINAARDSKSLFSNLIDGYKGDMLKLSAAVTASILSIGLIGLIIAKYTPVFDIISYIFYPFTFLLQIPEPMIAAKAVSIEIVEMFLPTLLVVDMPIITKFVVAVTSTTAILFFSASIPALLSTDIPIKIRDIVIIWIQRTVLSLIFSAAIAHIVF
ncbi:YjiH family protein [Lysinibacillus xylanilyticus]|uniref:YjiH family protein n=1 Tax=Lysinibacillus xylanilyticus TaxID=582475 RepID=UPI003D079634